MPKSCASIRLAVCAALALFAPPILSAEEMWIAPAFPGTANSTSAIWPTTAEGFTFLTFGVPDDLLAFASASIILLPEATSTGPETYQVFMEVKRSGEVVAVADWSAQAGAASFTRNSLQSVDISAQLGAELETTSPGSDIVSLFFWFPAGTGRTRARVVGMRFAYTAANQPGPDTVGPAAIISGSVTAQEIDPSTVQRRVVQSCPAGQSIRSIDEIGNVTCEPDDVGIGGAITGVIAGHGLTGGGTSGTVTLSADTSVVQTRVTGHCPAGQSIRSIDASGAVTCDTDDGSYSVGAGLILSDGVLSVDPGAFSTTLHTIDDSDSAGWSNSLVIGADGLGLIAYHDAYQRLKVAHCTDTACSRATISTIVPTAVGAHYPSVVVGADGLPLIVFSAEVGGLSVARCSDVFCSTAVISTIDADGGFYGSIAIGTDGLGLVAYRWDSSLRVAHCLDMACSAATISTIDSSGDVGLRPSLAIGTDGYGLISYYDKTNGDLKVAHCADTDCASTSTVTVDDVDDVGRFNSMAIGTDGLGLVTYWDDSRQGLKSAHCDDVSCSSAKISALGYVGGGGNIVSLAIGPDGLGLTSFLQGEGLALGVARCSNIECTSARFTTFDRIHMMVGWAYSSVAIGTDGRGLISYQNFGARSLKAAHLGIGVP